MRRMAPPPAVSIIMPVLDMATFVNASINSVLRQTIDEWELVVVDDGSTDGTSQIIDEYAARDPRVRLLAHPDAVNRGTAASRNLGLREARGSVVGFLDGDDLYEPDALASILRILQQNSDISAVYGATRWFYMEAGRPAHLEHLSVSTERTYPPPQLLRRVLVRQEGDIPCTCSFFCRREVALSVGGFEERFRLYEDQSLWAKIFLHHPVHVTGRILSNYRQNDASTSAKAIRAGDYRPDGRSPAERDFFEWLEEVVHVAGIYDTGLDRDIQDRLAPYRHPFRTVLNGAVRKAGRRFRRLASAWR